MVRFFPLATIREGFTYCGNLGYVYNHRESPEIPNAPTDLEPWKIAVITVACVAFVLLVVDLVVFLVKK